MSGERSQPSTATFPTTYDLLPSIQIVLRLLGIYFFVVGASGMVQDIAGVIMLWREHVSEYGVGMLLDYLFPATFYGSLAYAVAGLYLMIGGRWVIENVFLPPRGDNDVLELTEQNELPRA